MTRIVRKAIFACLVFVIIFTAVFFKLCSYSNLVLYPKKPALNDPPSHWKATAKNPRDLGFEFEVVSFGTIDQVTLNGWFIPGKLNKAVILVHGFEANRVKMLKYCAFLNEAGYNILLFDLRYFGESSGKFCSMGYYEKNDIKASVSFLKNRGINDIGIIAESMGAVAVVFALEDQLNIRCAVLDSGFSDLKKVLLYRGSKDKHLSAWMLKPVIFSVERKLDRSMEQLSSGRAIRKVFTPVYVICGKNDQKVPYRQCEELYSNVNNPKFYWDADCGHAQSFNVYPLEYKDKILDFLSRYL